MTKVKLMALATIFTTSAFAGSEEKIMIRDFVARSVAAPEVRHEVAPVVASPKETTDSPTATSSKLSPKEALEDLNSRIAKAKKDRKDLSLLIIENYRGEYDKDKDEKYLSEARALDEQIRTLEKELPKAEHAVREILEKEFSAQVAQVNRQIEDIIRIIGKDKIDQYESLKTKKENMLYRRTYSEIFIDDEG